MPKTLEDMAADHFESATFLSTGPFRCVYCGKRFYVDFDFGGDNMYPPLVDGDRVCIDCIHEFEEEEEETE